uniref:Sel1 repeat family protein n=1 Tax=Gongylonema pulchrum TaxID=637853 RepID=A0A183D4G9_9BILA
LEDVEACWLLSTWYIGSGAKFVTSTSKRPRKANANLGELPRNMDLALKYGIRACDFGCFQSCVNVSRIYRIGEGVERDPEKARIYKEKAKKAYDCAVSGDKVDFTG